MRDAARPQRVAIPAVDTRGPVFIGPDQETRLQTHRIISAIGPVRVCTALLFGAAASVAVALWIALSPGVLPAFPTVAPARPSLTYRPDGGHADLVERRDRRGITRLWFTRAPAAEFQREHTGFLRGSRQRTTDTTPPPAWSRGLELIRVPPVWAKQTANTPLPERLGVEELAFGWPRRVFVRRTEHSINSGRPSHTLLNNEITVPVSVRDALDITQHTIPSSVNTPGLIANTLAFGMPVYMLLSLPKTLTACRRRIQYRCRACGYDSRYVFAPVCPECGIAVREDLLQRLFGTPYDRRRWRELERRAAQARREAWREDRIIPDEWILRGGAGDPSDLPKPRHRA